MAECRLFSHFATNHLRPGFHLFQSMRVEDLSPIGRGCKIVLFILMRSYVQIVARISIAQTIKTSFALVHVFIVNIYERFFLG